MNTKREDYIGKTVGQGCSSSRAYITVVIDMSKREEKHLRPELRFEALD